MPPAPGSSQVKVIPGEAERQRPSLLRGVIEKGKGGGSSGSCKHPKRGDGAEPPGVCGGHLPFFLSCRGGRAPEEEEEERVAEAGGPGKRKEPSRAKLVRVGSKEAVTPHSFSRFCLRSRQAAKAQPTAWLKRSPWEGGNGHSQAVTAQPGQPWGSQTGRSFGIPPPHNPKISGLLSGL